jgi:hypothetical protein
MVFKYIILSLFEFWVLLFRFLCPPFPTLSSIFLNIFFLYLEFYSFPTNFWCSCCLIFVSFCRCVLFFRFLFYCSSAEVEVVASRYLINEAICGHQIIVIKCPGYFASLCRFLSLISEVDFLVLNFLIFLISTFILILFFLYYVDDALSPFSQ